MSEAVNQRILEALNSGYDPQEILGKLSMSKNEEHRSWYENYSQAMRDRARESNAIDQRQKPSAPGFGIMDRLRSHVEETPGYQLVGEAALTAGGLYAGKRAIQKMFPSELTEQNKIARERLEMEKSGAMSPLDQVKLEKEQAIRDYHRKKVELLDKKLAGDEVVKATTAAPPTPSITKAEENIVLQSEENRFQKQAEAAQKAAAQPPVANQPVPPKPMVTAPPVAPATPAVQAPVVQTPSAPSVAQIAAETAPTVAPTVSQITQEAAPVPPPKAEDKAPTGRPKGSVTLKDTPETWQKLTKEGTTFLPGYGPGDNNLYNTYGAEGRKAILEKYNNGKPIGSYENYLKLNEKLKLGVPSSEVPGLMARLPSEEEAGNFSKLGKAAKIAGVGGLLVSAANLANAKTQGERGMAGANVLEAFLPPGANINEAGAPVLPPSILAAQKRQLEEMQKLGSPYRKR